LCVVCTSVIYVASSLRFCTSEARFGTDVRITALQSKIKVLEESQLEREPVVHRAADSKPEHISCTVCAWGVTVVATRSLNIDGEISRIFEQHDCTLYPKCDIPGCMRVATVGFRRLLDGNTLTTSGFAVDGKTNCCAVHEAETSAQYSGPDDIRVDLTSLKRG
jgi:hypothetical protein